MFLEGYHGTMDQLTFVVISFVCTVHDEIARKGKYKGWWRFLLIGRSKLGPRLCLSENPPRIESRGLKVTIDKDN